MSTSFPRNQKTLIYRKEKRAARSEIKFSVSDRFEFLNGFTKRKNERKRKGHKKAIEKVKEEKRIERENRKSVIEAEYRKALDAARANYGQSNEDTTGQAEKAEVITSVKESETFFPGDDEFGEVNVQIMPLEAPQFSANVDVNSLHIPSIAPKRVTNKHKRK